MDNKFTQELITLAGKYGFELYYFSADEDKDEVDIEMNLKNIRTNRKSDDSITIFTADTTGMSE